MHITDESKAKKSIIVSIDVGVAVPQFQVSLLIDI